MPNPKTLVPFKDILEAHEPDYRDTPPKGREAVITTIAVDISDEAAERGEPISDVGALRDQIINYYTNHRSVPKEEEAIPIRVGKRWTARLVIAHEYHDEIEKEVTAAGNFEPAERIAKWATVLSEKCDALSKEELMIYALLAEEWKAKGPPPEVKRLEADEKTGKYIHGILKELERQLGVHAIIFVAYQGKGGVIKVSDFESQGMPTKNRFGSCQHELLKKLRASWGPWANGAIKDDTPEGEACTSGPEQFLRRAPNRLWTLGPLPAEGEARVGELGKAMSLYIIQQWKLKGGSKRIAWKGIKEANESYISRKFLLPGRTFDNPTRFRESTLRKYWQLLYNQSQSGEEFTFKAVSRSGKGRNNKKAGGKPKKKGLPEAADGSLDSTSSDEDDEEEKGQGRNKGKNQDKPEDKDQDKPEDKDKDEDEDEDEDEDADFDQGPLMPNQCRSDAEKIAFLRALTHKGDVAYKAIIDAVVPMRVIMDRIQTGDRSATVDSPAACFSWEWDSLYGDPGLHEMPPKRRKLHEWLATDPHLTESGELVERAVLLEICLGMGILLDDARMVLFTEGDFSAGTPDYITGSNLQLRDYDLFQQYVAKLKDDLSGATPLGHGKRKASTGEPAHAQTRRKKVATQPLQDVAGTKGEESKEGAEPSNDAGTRKSTRAKKEPSKYKDFEIGVGKSKRKEVEKNKQEVSGPAKKRRGRK